MIRGRESYAIEDTVDIPMSQRKPRANPVFKGRSKFTPDEDENLKSLVETYGTGNWVFIAKKMPNRNSRQCRERYLNYLNPELNTDPWTEEEDKLLEVKFAQLGARWVHMVQYFPNRTDAMIKNRYMLLQRRRRKNKPSPITSPSTLVPIDDLLIDECEFFFFWPNE